MNIYFSKGFYLFIYLSSAWYILYLIFQQTLPVFNNDEIGERIQKKGIKCKFWENRIFNIEYYRRKQMMIEIEQIRRVPVSKFKYLGSILGTDETSISEVE